MLGGYTFFYYHKYFSEAQGSWKSNLCVLTNKFESNLGRFYGKYFIFTFLTHSNGFVNLVIHSSILNFMQYAADHNIMEEILVCTKMF